MSGDVDRAQAREEEFRSDMLAERSRRAHGAYTHTSAEFCAVCAEPIPTLRRLALLGVQTCIECQHDLERSLL